MTGHSVRNATFFDILNSLLLSCLYIIRVMEVLNDTPRALKKVLEDSEFLIYLFF